jgi:GntR family transcriptional regulator
MLIVLDPHSGVPFFRQIMDQVRLHIASGRLEPGDELPSIRQLAVPLGVNPMTISKAYNLLERDGVLDRRPGRPLVVAVQADERLTAERIAAVRRALAPVVALCRELSVDTETVVALLRRLLADAPADGSGPGAVADEEERS